MKSAFDLLARLAQAHGILLVFGAVFLLAVQIN